MLEVLDLHAGYNGNEVLHGVSVKVGEGDMVAIIGPNGAGKSTLLNCISGLVGTASGSIRLEGRDITGQAAFLDSRAGLLQVPEGRQILGELTVLENLQLGVTALHRRAPTHDLRSIYKLFPILEERGQQVAGSLSGGQQQMLAIGRALMGGPRVLLLDEPSLGLSPLLAKQVLGALRELNKQGLTILLVEQNARAALRATSRAYVMEQGRVVHAGPSAELAQDPNVIAHYLGQAESATAAQFALAAPSKRQGDFDMSDQSIRAQVLEAVHGLAAYGLGPAIGGHVSVRVPGQRQFYINAFDKTFEEMRLQDIALLDFDGNVLECETLVSLGQTFHHGIYKQREDVNAIVHTHGFWITAQSAFGRPVRNLHNLCTYFDQRTCVSPSDDFSAIGPALKDSDIAIIIPWHGAITFGPTLASACSLHVTLDLAARLDVTLPADTPQMPAHLRAEMQAVLGRANYLDVTWELIRRKGRDNFDGQRVISRPAH